MIALFTLAVTLCRLDDAGKLEEESRHLGIEEQQGDSVDQLLLRCCIIGVTIE